jgi:hypothetical protein
LYRDFTDFKKDYQPRIKTVKDEKNYLVTDCDSILARWGNHYMLLVIVGRQKYSQQNQECLSV